MVKKGKKQQEGMDPMLDLAALPVEKTEKTTRFSLDKSIDNMVGSLCDPIIMHKCAWATRDMIPEWLRTRITLDRMIELMLASKEGREPIGTNSEALAYMIPASMEAPMGHDWAQIYLHLATVVIDQEKNKVVPDDIRVDKLDRNQEDDLRRLKHWLYDTKLKHRQGRRKEIREELKKEEKETVASIQPAFDLGLDS